MIEGLKIRSALAPDIQRLMGFKHTCESDYVWQLDLQKAKAQISVSLRQVRLPRPVTVTYPREQFSLADEWKKTSKTFVALSPDGMPVGYIRLIEQVAAASVWVLDLVVNAGARRKGVATALLKSIEGWAFDRQHQQLFVEMSSKNNPAISLMQKNGFEFSGYNDHYYATQDVSLFFGKLLKG